VLRRRSFFQGRRQPGDAPSDIQWLHPGGGEMTDALWSAADARALGVRLDGDAITDVTEHGDPVRDDTLLVLMNAHAHAVPFALPDAGPGLAWVLEVDTARPSHAPDSAAQPARYELAGRSLAVFRAFWAAPPAGAGNGTSTRTT
jgi:glycogen operon protein